MAENLPGNVVLHLMQAHDLWRVKGVHDRNWACALYAYFTTLYIIYQFELRHLKDEKRKVY